MPESEKQITVDLQFMRRLVHDLRAPWQSIACFLHLLNEDIAKDGVPGGAADYIGLMDTSAQELKDLVRALGDFVHAYDERTVRTEPIRKVFHQAWGSVFDADDETVAVNHLSERSIRADPAFIANCFEKLLENARMYRSLERPLKIEVREMVVDGEWLIEIEDNGIGIEEKYLERCLEPFERLHTRSAYPGSGLGLFTAKALLEHVGGRIELAIGEIGTIARVRLPLACIAPASGE